MLSTAAVITSTSPALRRVNASAEPGAWVSASATPSRAKKPCACVTQIGIVVVEKNAINRSGFPLCAAARPAGTAASAAAAIKNDDRVVPRTRAPFSPRVAGPRYAKLRAEPTP